AWYRGDSRGAVSCFEGVRERGTANPRLLYTLGLLYFHAGKTDAGERLIESATAERPGVLPLVSPARLTDVLGRLGCRTANVTVRLALADALAANGQTAEARSLYIDLIRSLRQGCDYPPMAKEGLTEEAVRAAIAPQPLWHSIDLGGHLFVDGAGKPA